jgi:hypothetical protein
LGKGIQKSDWRSMRFDNLKDDIQLLIYKLISSITLTPISACEIRYGWPDIQVNTKFEKPIIYVLSPIVTSKDSHFAGLEKQNLELIIGCWNDRNTGGSARCDQVVSYLLNFFGNPQTCHNKTFDVTLGLTSYTNTTISAQDLYINETQDMGDIPTEEMQENRKELKIYLETY